MRRPPAAHVLALSLASGLVLSLVVRPRGASVLVVVGVLALVALVSHRIRLSALALCLVAAGAWWGALRLDGLDRSPLSSRIGSSAHLRVEVLGPARKGEYTLRLPVRVRLAGGMTLSEKAQLELPASVPVPPLGSVLELAAGIRAPRGPDRFGAFDEGAYLRRQGIHAVLEADRYRVVGRRGGLAGAADRVRGAIAGAVAPGLEGERRALVRGIVLGEDQGLAPELRERFRASGLYHLLAVSGQNVAYVVGGVLVVAWLVGISRVVGHVAAIGSVLLYVLAVGWQPSVVRAAVAGILASLAWLTSRGADAWYFLIMGACVLLAWSPYSLLDPGFQLSFAAVAAIFVIVPRLVALLPGLPIPRALGLVLAVSLACSVATAPILWLQFQAVPVLSVVANAMAAPVVGPILGLGLGAAAVDPLQPGVSVALSWLAGYLAAYLAGCARLIGGLPFAQVQSGAVLAAIVATACGALACWRWPRLRWPVGVIVLAALALVAPLKFWDSRTSVAPPDGLRVSFLDVGQGDATLVEVPEGAVLVDQGPPEAAVDRQLEERGLRRVTALVLTHPQRDHVGGAAATVRRLQVGTLLVSGQPTESSDELDALTAAGERGVRIAVARAGQVYRIGSLRLEVLWPAGRAPPSADPNEYAIVLLASYGAVDILLTADAESPVTGRLELPEVEVLKVAHHGSVDDGLPGLLRRLEPRIAVISVGEGNDYGHPAPSTLAALGDVFGLRVFRTDRDGTVVVESPDGRSLSVQAEG